VTSLDAHMPSFPFIFHPCLFNVETIVFLVQKKNKNQKEEDKGKETSRADGGRQTICYDTQKIMALGIQRHKMDQEYMPSR
jgi:hypothetical protein